MKKKSAIKLELKDLDVQSFVTISEIEKKIIFSGMNNASEPIDRRPRTQGPTYPCQKACTHGDPGPDTGAENATELISYWLVCPTDLCRISNLICF